MVVAEVWIILIVPVVVKPEHQHWRLTKPSQGHVSRQQWPERTNGGLAKIRRPGATTVLDN